MVKKFIILKVVLCFCGIAVNADSLIENSNFTEWKDNVPCHWEFAGGLSPDKMLQQQTENGVTELDLDIPYATHFQISQTDLPLKSGKSYSLSYDIASPTNSVSDITIICAFSSK